MYSGLSGESITETRVRMYQKQKIKTSSTLIPDEESIGQHLKRGDFQCSIWKQVLLREKLESQLLVQNIQLNLMLLMMAMLMMTMMIIYPGRKSPRFVLSHN